MITEGKWIRIYHEVWESYNKPGHNCVRLKLGQYRDDDNWGIIECLCTNKEVLKKLIEICDKNNLRIDFSGNYELVLREDFTNE